MTSRKWERRRKGNNGVGTNVIKKKKAGIQIFPTLFLTWEEEKGKLTLMCKSACR